MHISYFDYEVQLRQALYRARNMSYHYFDIDGGKIVSSGDFFDATGMVMAVSAPAPSQSEIEE